MGEIRNAVRTRHKILDAARAEFAAHGMDGTRIESIARRAKVQKQLIYHYFKNKRALYNEILEQTFRERESWQIPVDSPKSMFRNRFAFAVADRLWLRFLLWEAVEFSASKRIKWHARRVAALTRQRNAIQLQQDRGKLPGDLRPELLQLALYALANYPLIFPQITLLVSGLAPEKASFQKKWSAFLDALGENLGRPNSKRTRATRI